LNDVEHPVSRRHGRLTFLACVSASGDALTSIAIWEDENMTIGFRNPADMMEESFHEYRTNVFIPDIARLQENLVFGQELGPLSMDSVGAHCASVGVLYRFRSGHKLRAANQTGAGC
jgi:hypothetical protein